MTLFITLLLSLGCAAYLFNSTWEDIHVWRNWKKYIEDIRKHPFYNTDKKYDGRQNIVGFSILILTILYLTWSPVKYYLFIWALFNRIHGLVIRYQLDKYIYERRN